jgi:anaerobic selenocysteine-containing dehydrogenase
VTWKLRLSVRYIEGNPEHPLNKGVICAKDSSGIMKQVLTYSSSRSKARGW